MINNIIVESGICYIPLLEEELLYIMDMVGIKTMFNNAEEVCRHADIYNKLNLACSLFDTIQDDTNVIDIVKNGDIIDVVVESGIQQEKS